MMSGPQTTAVRNQTGEMRPVQRRTEPPPGHQAEERGQEHRRKRNQNVTWLQRKRRKREREN